MMKPAKILAYEVGVHEWTIYNWENGTSTPRFDLLCKWANALLCDLDLKTRRPFAIVRAASVRPLEFHMNKST